MIKLNTKNLLIISAILSITCLGLAVGWYYHTQDLIKDEYLTKNKVTEFPAWFWVRLVLWPSLILLVSISLFFINKSIIVEMGAVLNVLLGIAGGVLTLFTTSYSNVDVDIDSNNVVFIVLILAYVVGIIANGLIVTNLFGRQKTVNHANVIKSKEMLKEDVIDIQ